MRKLIIIPLLAISLTTIGQHDTLNKTDPEGRKTGYWISTDASGKKVYEGRFSQGKPVGRFIRYHANGAIRAEMNYLPDGVKVEAKLSDPEGHLRAEGAYRHQIKDGPWSFYSTKKKPVFKINYSGGKVNGEALRFDANGVLAEKTQWANNILDGIQVVYYPDNKPQAVITYRKGEIDGPYELRFPDGRPEVTGTYSSGLKNGKWSYYLPNGSLDYLLEYSKGKLLNPEILDQRQRDSFDRYEKNRLLLKDPQDFMNNPDELMIR